MWGCCGASAVSSTATFDFPSVEVDVVASFILVATNVEGDFEFISDVEVVELVDFVANGFEFDHLRIFSIGNFDDEFAFGEAAREGLHIF